MRGRALKLAQVVRTSIRRRRMRMSVNSNVVPVCSLPGSSPRPLTATHYRQVLSPSRAVAAVVFGQSEFSVVMAFCALLFIMFSRPFVMMCICWLLAVNLLRTGAASRCNSP